MTKSSNKTEYRIIAREGTLHDIYLQFKDYKVVGLFRKKVVEVWRVVPKSTISEISGKYLERHLCIEHDKFTHWDDFEHLGGYYGGEVLLERFVREWPNIDDYFEHLRERREKHLRTWDPDFYKKYLDEKAKVKSEQRKQFKIKYL